MVVPMTDRLPLVVGIAAHRRLHEQDPAVLAALQRRLSSILATLKRDYLGADTEKTIGGTPVIVISNLIGGAYRIAEGAAWANGARIVSPFGVHSPELAESLLKPDSQRDRAACLLIARYCHVLIVIWDRDENDPDAGAPAQIVSLRRKGVALQAAHTARACIDAAEIGPVIEIVLSKPAQDGAAPEIQVPPWGLEFMKPYDESRLEKLKRGARDFARHLRGRRAEPATPGLSGQDKQAFESWKSFAALIGLTKEFNLDAAGLDRTADGADRAAASLDRLFGIDTGAARGREALAGAMRLVPRWCRTYAIADTLAQTWQKKFWQDWFRLFGLGLCAVACFEVFAHLADWPTPHWSWLPIGRTDAEASPATDIVLLGGYLGALFGIFGVYRKALAHRHQERFLDYRAFAEALRVAIFWQLMGVGEAVGRAAPCVADAYPIKQPAELAWVKTCLWTLEFLDHAERPGASRPVDEATAYHWLRDLWVQGQDGYFTRNAHRHDELAAIHEDRAYALLFASIAVAVCLILFKVGIPGIDPNNWHQHGLRHDLMIFALGMLPGVAAAVLGYSEKLAYMAQARQYDRMRGVFGQALLHLPEQPAPNDYRQIKELFYHLGVEAMREHAEWVAIYRQRPIQPPSG